MLKTTQNIGFQGIWQSRQSGMTKTSVYHTNQWDIQTAQALNHIWIKEKAPHSSKEPLNTTSVSWYKHRNVFFFGGL